MDPHEALVTVAPERFRLTKAAAMHIGDDEAAQDKEEICPSRPKAEKIAKRNLIVALIALAVGAQAEKRPFSAAVAANGVIASLRPL